MPVAAYRAWDHAGRPITPAQPIRELVAALKAKFPRAASGFGWYANDAHYAAVPAGDHTPYSSDAWPVTPNPQWVVFATDVMHHPELGVDCRILGPYWLAEAKAGRMPWLKYLIWDGHLYDVRHQWAQQAADDHYDHVHLSARTDAQHTSLGSWPITPPPSTPTTEDNMAGADATWVAGLVNQANWKLDAMGKVVAAQTATLAEVVKALAAVGTASPEVTGLLASVQTKLDAQTAALNAAMAATVADLGEGGAAQVRRHATGGTP
jgi:hypothetical protein